MTQNKNPHTWTAEDLNEAYGEYLEGLSRKGAIEDLSEAFQVCEKLRSSFLEGQCERYDDEQSADEDDLPDVSFDHRATPSEVIDTVNDILTSKGISLKFEELPCEGDSYDFDLV